MTTPWKKINREIGAPISLYLGPPLGPTILGKDQCLSDGWLQTMKTPTQSRGVLSINNKRILLGIDHFKVGALTWDDEVGMMGWLEENGFWKKKKKGSVRPFWKFYSKGIAVIWKFWPRTEAFLWEFEKILTWFIILPLIEHFSILGLIIGLLLKIPLTDMKIINKCKIRVMRTVLYS